jgi:hypothetical protein
MQTRLRGINVIAATTATTCLALSAIAFDAQVSSRSSTTLSTSVTVTSGQTAQVNFALNTPGTLSLFIPDVVSINEPFTIDVAYQPATAVAGAAATVYFDSNSNVSYDQPQVTLQPFRRAHVTVTIKKAASGLARIMAYSGCCPARIVTVVCDFKGRLRSLDPDVLESRQKQPVSVVLEDNQGRPLILDADLDLRISAFNADISTDGERWHTTIASKIKKGAARSEFFYVRPTPVDNASAHIQVTGYGEAGNVAFSDDLPFTVTSPWWLKLAMAMLGAFLYALYKRLNASSTDTEFVTFLRSLGAALIAGVFAYELANLNVFGIRLDTTSLHGFVVLGLLTAYVGVEPLLAKFVERRNERTSRSDVQTAVSSTSDPS